jgi:hypothetical protein
MKTASFVALAVLAAFVAGCASTDSAASRRPAGPPANVAGSWSGFTVGAGGTSVSLELRQSGNAVTGTIEVGGRPDLSGPLEGTISGNTVRFRLTSGFGSAGELNVSSDTITGIVGGSGLTLRRI